MNTMNTEINMINANNFKTTKESREKLMSLLNTKEQKIFKDFVKSVNKWLKQQAIKRRAFSSPFYLLRCFVLKHLSDI